MFRAWTKPGIIIGLTKSVVGEKFLNSEEASKMAEDPKVLYNSLDTKVIEKLGVMSNEKLGQICGYATTQGYHSMSFVKGHVFINKTGIQDIKDNHFAGPFAGRWFLLVLAADTVICVARDIILQDQWKATWQTDEELQAQGLERTATHITSVKGAKYMGGGD